MKNTSLFLASIFMGANSLFAADTNSQPLKACMVLWPPFITKEGNDIKGPDTDVLKLIAERKGYTLQIQEIPWKRCLEMAEKGEMDIVYSASKKAEREVFLYYPQTQLHTTRYVFATKPNTQTDWATSKDPKSLPQPVGSVLGYSVTDELKSKQVKVDDGASSDPQNLDKFLGGRVQSFIIEESVLKSLLEGKYAKNKSEVEILEPPYEDKKDYYITISKKSSQGEKILKDFEAELQKMKNEGEIEKIYKAAFKAGV